MKRIIAREWLILISFLFLGSIFSIIFYFDDYEVYKQKNILFYGNKKYFYDALTREVKNKRNKKELKTEVNIEKESTPNKLKNNPYYTDLEIKVNSIPILNEEGIIEFIRKDTNTPLCIMQQWVLSQNQNINDTSLPLGTFDQFYELLDDSVMRKNLYDTLLKYSGYSEDYKSFKNIFLRPEKPKIFNGTTKFINHLFSKYYWFETWMSVLILYFLFQFIRTIIFSIRVLRHK